MNTSYPPIEFPSLQTAEQRAGWLSCLQVAAFFSRDQRRDNESMLMATTRLADVLYAEWLKRQHEAGGLEESTTFSK